MSLLQSSQTRLFESFPFLRIYGTANRLSVLSDGPAAPVGTDPQGLSRVLCLVFKEQCAEWASHSDYKQQSYRAALLAVKAHLLFFYLKNRSFYVPYVQPQKRIWGLRTRTSVPLPAPDFRSCPLQIFALTGRFATENRREHQRLRVGIISRVRRLSSGTWLRRTQTR